MTTSAPQWPGQEGVQERGSDPSSSPAGPALRVVPRGSPRLPQPVPGPPSALGQAVVPDQVAAPDQVVGPEWPVARERPDAGERDLWEKRRRARPGLPSPAAVTRDIALALLEVEAGCRSAVQLERIFSPELWEALEQRIGRRGGPLPSGRSLISVHCQEDRPGLADTVAVVHKGRLVRPVALRLDASGGRWRVTELRWWRNETDTTTTPGRDGGSS